MRRLLLGTISILYAAAVVAITIFPVRPHPAAYWIGEPFAEMFHWIPGDVDAPSFVLNIHLFVPFGILGPLLWRAFDGYGRIALRAVTASAAIELTQLVLGVTIGSRRTVDVNDLIANTAGALAGLLILRLAVPSPTHRAWFRTRPLSALFARVSSARASSARASFARAGRGETRRGWFGASPGGVRPAGPARRGES